MALAGEGAWTEVVTFRTAMLDGATEPVVAVPPRVLELSSGALNLDWAPCISSFVCGYKLRVSEDGGLNWSVLYNAPALFYEWTEPTCGQAYQFQVAATTAAGFSSSSLPIIPFQTTPCPPDCPNACHSQGVCNIGGVCECNEGRFYPDCSGYLPSKPLGLAAVVVESVHVELE